MVEELNEGIVRGLANVVVFDPIFPMLIERAPGVLFRNDQKAPPDALVIPLMSVMVLNPLFRML